MLAYHLIWLLQFRHRDLGRTGLSPTGKRATSTFMNDPSAAPMIVT